MKRVVGISTHDVYNAEVHHFVRQAAAAQQVLSLRKFFVPKSHRLIASPEIDAEEACKEVYDLKVKQGLQPNDTAIVVTSANISDFEDDEYYSVSNLDYRRIRGRCPGAGLTSLFYLERRSDFTRKSMKHGTWSGMSTRNRRRALSDSITLNLLSAVAAQTVGLPTHDTTRGCVMDYCQRGPDLLRSLRRGFVFCERCARRLRGRAVGRAVIAIARRLTARSFHSDPPVVFLSYSRIDRRHARRVWQGLTERGYSELSMDERAIVPGELWEQKVQKQLRAAERVIILLSRAALARKGYFHSEVQMALALARRKTGGYVIPVLIDRVKLPTGFARFNAIDLYPKPEESIDRISAALAGYEI